MAVSRIEKSASDFHRKFLKSIAKK